MTFNDYYVYAFFKENGQIFWIGKGRRGRWDWHKDTRRNRYPNIADIINNTVLVLGDLPRVKLAENLSEEDAFNLERLFITVIGKYPNGPLLNKADGGKGALGIKFTKEQKERASRAVASVWAGYTLDQKQRRMSVIHNFMRGKPQKAEHIEARSVALRGRSKSKEHNIKVGLAVRETNMWKTVRESLSPFGRFIRVENRLEAGTPDVYYCVKGHSGWIELKVGHKIGDPPLHLTLAQITWLEEETARGGNAFLMIKVDKSWLLYNSDQARKLYRKIEIAPIINIAGKFPTREVLNILTSKLNETINNNTHVPIGAYCIMSPHGGLISTSISRTADLAWRAAVAANRLTISELHDRGWRVARLRCEFEGYEEMGEG